MAKVILEIKDGKDGKILREFKPSLNQMDLRIKAGEKSGAFVDAMTLSVMMLCMDRGLFDPYEVLKNSNKKSSIIIQP